jgi:hypothetical protein
LIIDLGLHFFRARPQEELKRLDGTLRWVGEGWASIAIPCRGLEDGDIDEELDRLRPAVLVRLRAVNRSPCLIDFLGGDELVVCPSGIEGVRAE